VRKAMWWKDMKMRMCIIGAIVAIILIAVIVPRMFSHSRNQPDAY